MLEGWCTVHITSNQCDLSILNELGISVELYWGLDVSCRGMVVACGGIHGEG